MTIAVSSSVNWHMQMLQVCRLENSVKDSLNVMFTTKVRVMQSPSATVLIW